MGERERRRIVKLLSQEEKWPFLRELVRELILQDSLDEFPEIVEKFQADPVFCADMILHKPVESLYWYQKLLMRRVWSFEGTVEGTLLIEKGRQIGITYACGLLSDCWALIHPKNVILHISRNLDQAKEMYNYAKDIMIENDLVKEKFLAKEPTATRMLFRNQSLIRAMGCRLPYADNIRGKRAHLYFLDEAILIYDKMFDSIDPITTHTHGHRAYITTAGQHDCYFFRLKRMIEKGELPNAELFTWPACKEAEDGTLYDPICPAMTIEQLERKRKEKKTLRFGREYLCKWLGAANMMFPNYEKCIYDYELLSRSANPCYGGLDVGRIQNPTVLILLENRGKDEPLRYVYGNAWYQRTFDKVANDIENIAKRFNIQRIVLDQRGMGQGLLEKLEERHLPVEGRNWTSDKKNQDMFALQSLIDEQKIRFPSSEEQLKHEIKGYTCEPKEGSNLFNFDCIESDDWVDALAFAVYSSKKEEPGGVLSRAW